MLYLDGNPKVSSVWIDNFEQKLYGTYDSRDRFNFPQCQKDGLEREAMIAVCLNISQFFNLTKQNCCDLNSFVCELETKKPNPK